MTVTLVDYGAGNLPSVERALRRLGAETRRAREPAELAGARVLVLPGVGHFAALARTLAERHLLTPLRAVLAEGVPFLGICLGLQALYEASEEAPGERGLGLLRGVVEPLPAGVKLPHMGWNQLRRLRPSRLLRDVPEDAYFYFAHSFAACYPDEATAAVCDYAASFVAVLERANLYGVQFHPEKSGEAGAAVLKNFLELAR
jgi:imidazole glycerol phosphate synthase glutamine amidotransferase subunit